MNQYNINEILNNKQAYYKFFIEKTFESGISLLAWEVKSARLKLITIDNSYISFKGYEAFIYNAVFQNSIKHNVSEYNPIRIRKLLLTKKELLFLKSQTNQYGYTIIVLSLFWKNNWIKASIGLAKGKKKYDKRHIIHKTSWKKEKIHITKCINK